MVKHKNAHDPASVAKTAMPGWRVVSVTDSSPVRKMRLKLGNPASDRVMPDLGELQKLCGLLPGAGATEIADETTEKLHVVKLSADGMTKLVGVQGGKVVWTQG